MILTIDSVQKSDTEKEYVLEARNGEGAYEYRIILSTATEPAGKKKEKKKKQKNRWNQEFDYCKKKKKEKKRITRSHRAPKVACRNHVKLSLTSKWKA